jgi:hypothetical protein
VSVIDVYQVARPKEAIEAGGSHILDASFSQRTTVYMVAHVYYCKDATLTLSISYRENDFFSIEKEIKYTLKNAAIGHAYALRLVSSIIRVAS